MYLSNEKKFNNDYICIRNLVIMSDSEYGYHVYFQHGYRDYEFSFFTESENLIDIINEIIDKLILLDKNLS